MVTKRGIAWIALVWIILSITSTYEALNGPIYTFPTIITGKAVAQGTVQLTVQETEITTIAGPRNVTAIFVEDNSSVRINWTEVSGADNYTLYYSNNLTLIKNLNLSEVLPAYVINITDLTDLNWSDENFRAETRRFYRIASVKGSVKNLSDDVVGKQDIPVLAGSSTTLSLPFDPVNYSIMYLIRPVQPYCGAAACADKIRMFYGSLKTKYSYWYGQYGWFSSSTPKLENIDPNVGYIIKPTNFSYNITFAGRVPVYASNITLELIAGSSNTYAVHSPYYYNLSKFIVPSQPYCGAAACADKVRMFYGNLQTKYSYWYGIYGWFSSSTPKLIDFEPGYGYVFKPINISYNVSINVSDGEFK